jgi:hypothetical protein
MPSDTNPLAKAMVNMNCNQRGNNAPASQPSNNNSTEAIHKRRMV